MIWLLQDAWRSLCRSKWENLLTIGMLALVLWASTLVLSYYADVPLAKHTPQKLYSLRTATTDATQLQQNIGAGLSMYTDPSAIHTIRQVLAELREMSQITYVRSRACEVLLPNAKFDSLRKTNALMPYLAHPAYSPIKLAMAADMSKTVPIVPTLESMEKSDKPEKHPQIDDQILAVQAVRVDEAAAVLFNVQAEQGRTWNKQDFIWSSSSEAVPVLMGSEYRGLFTIGEKLPLLDELISTVYFAQIIGFLPQGAELSHVSYDGIDTVRSTLDYTVLLPVFTSAPALGRNEPLNDSLTYQSGGIVFVPPELERAEFVQAQRTMNDIFVRNGFPSSFFGEPTFGLLYFQAESAASMAVLLRLVLLAVIFCTGLVCLRFIAKANRNLRGYAVQVMLGSPVSAVTGSFIIEMLAVLACPTLLVCGIFWQQIAANDFFVLLVCGVQLSMALLIGVIITAMLLRMDVEQAIRRPE